MNLRSRYRLSLSAISLFVCSLLVSVVTLPRGVFGAEVQELRSELVAQATTTLKEEGDRVLSRGAEQYNNSQFEAALQSYQQALNIYREIKFRQGELWALSDLRSTYIRLGKYDKAIDHQLQSLAIAREIKDRKRELSDLTGLGLDYSSLEKYDKAIEYRLQSLALARELRDRKNEISSLEGLGLAYGSLNQYEKAIEYTAQKLTIARELKDRKSEFSALQFLGIYYHSHGKYDKAIEYTLQSLVIARELKDLTSEILALSFLGGFYQSLSKYNETIKYYEQSLAIAREIKNRVLESGALTSIGNAYEALGKYNEAINYRLQSLAIARETKDRTAEGVSAGNLGVAYNALGKYDKAIDYIQQSLAIYKEIKNRSGEGVALANLGSIYSALNKYDKAIDYSQQSLVIVREAKNRQREASILGNLGFAYDALGKHDKAIEFQLQSLAIARELKDRGREVNALVNLGTSYRELDRSQEAIASLQQALIIAREIGDRNGEGYTLANLGKSLSKAKRPELAIIFYKQSINVREAIRKDITKLDKDLQQSYLATVEITYRDLANTLLQQNRIIEALQVLDLLKVQELEDYLKNIKGSDRTSQGVRLLAPEKAVSDKPLTISFENAPELNNQLASQIQQLPQSEINKVPDYLNQIPKRTVLLYPFILGDRLEIILFSPNNIPIRRTTKISKDQLETLIVDFRSGLLDPSSEDVKAPSTELYNLLIRPIEAELVQLQAKTILYAPDGQLRYVPIAALYNGKQWLAEKYQISNLIAYTLSDFSLQPKNTPNILAGAFGGKAGEQKFGQTALPATLTEVQAIANSFQNSVTLLENQFSRQAIESKFKNHNILHLATHAEFNTGIPDNSFIIFGNGDKIRLGEITDWQIPNIDLIILSACQTGIGKLGDGVEILGFGYQVQKAGAKQVVASLWKVDDTGTQALMKAFYGELQKSDVTVTEALRRAQVSLIKSSSFNHPFYWSAFFAIGNGL